MKFKLENRPPGLIVCTLVEAVSQEESAQIVQGVIKLLANGKARIVVNFTEKALKGQATPAHFEASLRQQRELARKLGGDIKYVVPKSADPKQAASLEGAFETLDEALQALTRGPSGEAVALSEKEAEITRLKADNQRLLRKVEELLNLVRAPCSDDELKRSAEHFRALAAESEATPASPPPASPPKK